MSADRQRETITQRQATRDLLGGAFDNACLLAPSNMLTPDIPLPNLVAMFEDCHER
jgi:hypothetical protein